MEPHDGLVIKSMATGRTIPDEPKACLIFRTDYETDLLYVDQVVKLRDALSAWLVSVNTESSPAPEAMRLGTFGGFDVRLSGHMTAQNVADAITEQTGGAYRGFVKNGCVEWSGPRAPFGVRINFENDRMIEFSTKGVPEITRNTECSSPRPAVTVQIPTDLP